MVLPHTHTNTLTTIVTSGTAFVGNTSNDATAQSSGTFFSEAIRDVIQIVAAQTGPVFDEQALVAYPEGTFFVTPAGSPHFIMARDGAFSILDHGSGPSSNTILD